MCDHDHTARAAVTFAEPTSAEPASRVWTCPMHPEVRSDEPGRCPKCRMYLVETR